MTMTKVSIRWFIFLTCVHLSTCTSSSVKFVNSSESESIEDTAETYQAEESKFFPNEFKSTVKFPNDSEAKTERESRSQVQETAASEHLDDIDENTAIDIILAATKSGR